MKNENLANVVETSTMAAPHGREGDSSN